MKILVVVVVYDRVRNTERWKRAWRAIPRSESFCIVRNVDGGVLRKVEETPLVIERPNVGMDMGIFQDIIHRRLDVPEWSWLFMVPDDWLPMRLDFLEPFKEIAEIPVVGLIGAKPHQEPWRGIGLHCRSGGFMIRREVAENLVFPTDPIVTKHDCYMLEYGTHNLMQQVIDMGYEVRFLNEPDRLVLWDQGHESGRMGLDQFPARDMYDVLSCVGSDKVSVHSYGDVYEALCAPFQDTTSAILEIGGLGHSLVAWHKYFAKARIYGIGLNPLLPSEAYDRITTQVIDVKDPFQLSTFAEQTGLFQLIVDDGSHVTTDMLAAYSILRSFLIEDGIYVIEDVQDQESIEMFRRLPDVTVYDLRSVHGRYDDVLIVYRNTRKQ